MVIVGETGRNFTAGMSGGVAYILDEVGDFGTRCNQQMVGLETLSEPEDIADLRQLIQQHLDYTGSLKATQVLANWEAMVPQFIKMMLKDYKRMLQAISAT